MKKINKRDLTGALKQNKYITLSRRSFIKTTIASAVSFSLAACGGGSNEPDTTPPINSETNDTSESTPETESNSGTTPKSEFLQLPSGHYEPTKIPAELIFPRPDSETNLWAKHRHHYTGIPYRIPIGVSFGSWPFNFEIIEAPTGVTIGSQLVPAGDKLIAGEDYGTVQWDNPQEGDHSFHIKVHFQDGTTPLDVMWNLNVSTSGTIFCDAFNGSDTTGTGSLSNPFKTMDGWFKSDNTDRTFSGYQVCYLSGTYNVATSDPATTGNMKMDFYNKPLVHYAPPGENVIWNFDSGNFTSGIRKADSSAGEYHMTDWFLGNITCSGGKQSDNSRRWFLTSAVRGNQFPYDGSGGGKRCTWFESPQIDWNFTGDSSNNGGICFASNTGNTNLGRSHWLISRCNANNITGTSGNFNGWFVGNMAYFLMENLSVTKCGFGRAYMSGKSSEHRSCYRNIDVSQSSGKWNIDNAGSYAPQAGGGSEISYCKFINSTPGRTLNALALGLHSDTYNANNPYHFENYIFRNNLSKAPTSTGEVLTSFFNWPLNIDKDIWCSSGDGLYGTTPLNTQTEGDWVLYDVINNPFDSKLNLTGEARKLLLGTHGAEIA